MTATSAQPQDLRWAAAMRNLMDASPDFFCFKDGEGRWLAANESARRLFGLSEDQYIAKRADELAQLAHPCHAATLQDCHQSDERAWQGGETVREEQTIPLPGGKQRIYDVYKMPLFHSDGSRNVLLVLGRDISERKEVERHLAARGAILDALISCDWLLHSSEAWQKVAPRVVELLGIASDYGRVSLFLVEADAFGGFTASCQSVWRSSPADALPDWERIDFNASACSRWQEVLSRGQPIYGDGEDFPADERAMLQSWGIRSLLLVPVMAGDDWWGVLAVERGRATGEWSSYEIGALMAAGRSFGVAVQRSADHDRLQQAMVAFDSATEGIMVTDARSRILAVNQGFVDITGYSEQEVLGKTPDILQSGRHDPAFYQEMWQRIETQGRWQGEIWDRRKNGEIYPEWLTISAVRDDEGAVVKYVAVFADISEKKHAQDRLHSLVNRDPLTGLPNRRLLDELMQHAIKRAERDACMVAVLFVDLDRFKAINDTLGHLVGDKLLLDVAKRLTGAIRESDTVARLGGDEFVVMMDELRNREEAALVAKKALLTLQSEFRIDNRELYVGASIGISVYPDDAQTADDLIKAADIAMYQVKNSGKNNYTYYSSDLSQNAVERFTMEVELRRALERRQFELYYQPQVSLQTGKIVGAEALVRWKHPELGIVSPAKFIPLAEETGLIVQIGEWVLNEAARQLVEWGPLGQALQSLSVNVSGVQIQRGNFADTVYGVLLETGCEASRIELEITESTVMHNTEKVLGVFRRIKQMGVRFAIDDFGTGYSSLAHLKRLPLDKIKIDQSFVRDLPHDVDDAAISHAIKALGHSLGLTVIAEGVETKAQETFLKNMGCDQLQGYLYSPPVTAQAFVRLLQQEDMKREHD